MHEVVVTGIGLVSSLGVGADAHYAALSKPVAPVFDHGSIAPFPIHPLPQIDYDELIPKKGDQRQMDPGQRLGVYAAGLALRDGGILGDAGALAKTHLIVAAGDGERDIAVDEAILSGIRNADNRDAYLNERMSRDIRPTLFLAQLPNLLAGNISIVHGVTGSSRTFMGEEFAGLDAIATMAARIRSGTVDMGLVGGAYAAVRPDIALLLGFGGSLLAGEPAGVWSRHARGGGMICGSVGAFLLLESRAHAQARGARIAASIGPVLSENCHRKPGALPVVAGELWSAMETALAPGALGVLSGATGVEPATEHELASLDALRTRHDVHVRATGTQIGHALEAAAPANVALAALALREGGFYPPFADADAASADVEREAASPPAQIVVTSFGHWRGEGMILLRRFEGSRA